MKVPPGLSWGFRGFRVGKSPSGRWWMSIGLPFGLRYSWFLQPDRHPVQLAPKTQQNRELLTSEEEANRRIETARNSPSKFKSKA